MATFKLTSSPDAPTWTVRLTPVRAALLLLTAVFTCLALWRLVVGLGATTNLNDRWPWGLWIGFDLTAVALAGAGYSMCLMAHILHIKGFHSVARRAMLLSLLGYIYVLLTLVLEVGRWDNVYRPLISWGHTSPLFEVYIAITFYMVIQLIEFSEVATEKVFKPVHKFIQIILPAALILGAIIPFGHQASLGGIYLLMKGKLHGLWWSEMIPWFFLLTSFYVGPAMVVLESIWSAKVFGRQVDLDVLQRLVRISAVLMAIYFVWKFVDLSMLGALPLAHSPSFESAMFWLEMAGCVALPAVIGLTPLSKSKTGMAVFSILCISGIVLSRMNVVFTGMYRALGPGYTPSWIEWGITVGLIGAMVLAYAVIVENFDIYSEHPHTGVKKPASTPVSSALAS